MVLSLSPGPAALEKAEELRQYAQIWRISDDVWDLWHGDTQFLTIPRTSSPPAQNHRSAKEKEFPRLFALCSPVNPLEERG